jgi:hypothetical protein
MLKAVLRNGAIVPLDPVPKDWEEGTSLEVVRINGSTVDIQDWAKQMERLCAASSDEDEESMHAAIKEHRRQAKAQTRREMGLSE